MRLTPPRDPLSLIPLRKRTLLWDVLYYLSNLLTSITGHPLPTTTFLTKYQFLYPRMLYKLQVSDSIFCEFQHTNMLINYGFSSINFFLYQFSFFLWTRNLEGWGEAVFPLRMHQIESLERLIGLQYIDQIVHSNQALHPEKHFRVLN